MKDPAAIVIGALVLLLLLYAWMAWQDYRFGVRQRRIRNFKGSGWSRWADLGWSAEERRRKMS